MKLLSRYLLIALCLIAATLQSYAASVRLQVSPYPGRSSINVGDKFYVIIKLDNVNGDLRQFDVPGATVSYLGSSSSQMVSTMSGSYSSGEYTMVCRAQEKGNFTLGPITVGNVRSNAVRYSIGGGSSAQNQNMQPTATTTQRNGNNSGPTYIGKGNGNLFMRASISKTTAYEQEALVYTVKLYSSFSRIKFIGATASPKFDGFVVEESKQTDTQLHAETFQGRTYATAVIARYIIFPQMTGQLKVVGNTYTVSVDEREYYRDEFFGSMSVSRPLQLNVSPNDLSVNIKALPQPKPADFSGGVGKFSITSSMPNTHLKTGETAQIVYTISGAGNLKYVTLPDLSLTFPKQIEVYSPQTDVKTNVGASSVSGTARYDYSLMPDDEGDYTIPSVTLVYFNPESGTYEKAVARGYNVTVGKGSASSRSQRKARATFDPDLMSVDEGMAKDKADVMTFAYWLWFIIPTMLLAGAIVVYRKHMNDMADLASTLSRRANKMANKRLRKARNFMNKGDREHFYDEMLHALWGYISYKMKMPTSELSRDNISGMLDSKGIPANMIDNFIALLDACEYEKYAPADSASAAMGEIYQRGVASINELEDSFKK